MEKLINVACNCSADVQTSIYCKYCYCVKNSDSCNFTRDANFCTSCNYCRNVYFSRFSDRCINLIFCHSVNSGSTNHAFNKPVTTGRFSQIVHYVNHIFKDVHVTNNILYTYEKDVTNEMWIKISRIPEFNNSIVERITGIDVYEKLKNSEVKIEVDGKIVYISRKSAIALNLVKE